MMPLKAYVAKAWAWLTGGIAVALEDFEFDVYYTVARKHPFGRITCDPYWPYRVGHCCVLLDDGTIKQSNYVKRWARI